jgi:hypothetical protein
MVPQRWGNDSSAPPISLRVSQDLPRRRLALTVGTDQLWSGHRRTFLRKRRIAVPCAIDATQLAKLAIIG